jgi:hypothetical protein
LKVSAPIFLLFEFNSLFVFRDSDITFRSSRPERVAGICYH